jgi:curved DNA-binding protein CbpA
MNRPQPDYYALLGLSPAVTSAEIKRRYRELARQYHPDVNPSPEAAQKIKQINEAYHILSDPDRRNLYDADRMLQKQRAERAAQRRAEANAERQRRSSARASYQDGGASPRRHAPGSPGPERHGAEGRRATGTFAAVEQLIAEAQLAYINRHYREAEGLCHQALLLDRNNALAYEILGDIFLKRGQRDSASMAYSYSVQFNPRNHGAQLKLERLLGRRDSLSVHPSATRPLTAAGLQQFKDNPNWETNLFLINVILFLALFGVIAIFGFHSGTIWMLELSVNLVFTLLVSGVLAGTLLAFNGGMRPISEELLKAETRSDGSRRPATLGVLLALFALAWFYLSFLVYVGIGYARNRLSPSVLKVYGLTLVLLILFGYLYKPVDGHPRTAYGLYVVLFGGNLLFPAMLFGWAIGDVIRLRRR